MTIEQRSTQALVATKLCTSTCPYCGVGCGIDIFKENSVDSESGKITTRISHIQGQKEHPANFGRLCVKGSNLLETNSLEGRLLEPKIDNKIVSYQKAVEHVAKGFKDTIEQYGPDSVAFYVSGQLLTEDYYVANKLMKGYIGSANIDTNSRLCMSSAVAGYKRAFGSDTVPCNYEDLSHTECLVLTGSNAAWTHPVLFQRIERAKKLNPNMRIIVLDPRRTSSCEIADLHLPIKAGSDAALFNGLLNYLCAHEQLATDYINANTEGFEQALRRAKKWSIDQVAHACDVSTDDVSTFYAYFATAKTAITFFSMGINQSNSGVDKANAIINCHLASGKIGQAGSGPFSITGQPNAMGGREVGGLANMLAAHMDIENVAHQHCVQSFWQSPAIAKKQGLKAVDLFDAIENGHIKAVWIMATNPLVSMPNRNRIEAALKQCPLVVVSDIVEKNDTLSFADVALPATGWSEKDGTVTNSERRISRQSAILPAPGEARHDWQMICDVAKAMGFDTGFDFSHPAQIFDEHARLSAFKNDFTRDFDLSGLIGLSEQQYNNLIPIQWPVNSEFPNGTSRMFTNGKFFTSSKKAQFIPISPRLPEQQTTAKFPLVLNTGRIRDQWHTMTRTSKASSLNEHTSEPYVAMHSDTAAKYAFTEGELAALISKVSNKLSCVMRVRIDDTLRKGDCFAPIHWSETNSSSASVARLFSSAKDPISGQPELKHAAVQLTKVSVSSSAQIFSRTQLPAFVLSQMVYWVCSRTDFGYQYSLASTAEVSALGAGLLELAQQSGQLLQRRTSKSEHALGLNDDCLSLAIYCYAQDNNAQYDLSTTWLSEQFTQSALDSAQIASLLRAQPSQEYLQGKLICSCFKVGEHAINDAIASGCNTVQGLGEKLKCGTNCGSCKTELSAMITDFVAKNSAYIPSSFERNAIPINDMNDNMAKTTQPADESPSATLSSLSREQD